MDYSLKCEARSRNSKSSPHKPDKQRGNKGAGYIFQSNSKNVSGPNGTYLRTLPRKYTEGHGTVSGQAIYFSVFFRVLPWPIVLRIFMKLLK
jgi:hypothetical protein